MPFLPFLGTYTVKIARTQPAWSRLVFTFANYIINFKQVFINHILSLLHLGAKTHIHINIGILEFSMGVYIILYECIDVRNGSIPKPAFEGHTKLERSSDTNERDDILG